YSALQVSTNGTPAGTNIYRTNGQVIKVLVGTSVSNAVISYLLPPVVNDGFYQMTQGDTLAVPAPGVLMNGTGAAAALASGPVNGTLVFNTNGSFTYMPTNNYTGMDGFTYEAVNGSLTSAVATASIMITTPAQLFYDNFARTAGSNSIFPWVNQMGSWSVTNKLLQGSCALDNYGYAYYNTNWTDYSVQAQIRYPSTSVWGGAIGGRLNPATGAHYDVWILPENSPWGPDNGVPSGVPTLQILKYSDWFDYTAENLVRLPAVGTNWHNVKVAFLGSNVFAYFDGNLITNLVDNGTFDGQPALMNGGITAEVYAATPTAYTMSFSNFIVTPLLLNPSYSTKENTGLTVPKPGVLTNDLDVYGTNLIATLISGPTNGTLNLSTNGGFTYTPVTNFSGIDGFEFRLSDHQNVLGIATATITVTPLPTLTVTADNQARIYGTTNPILTFSYTGFTNNDGTNVLTGAPALSTSADVTSLIGIYTITVNQGTLNSTNYGFQFVNGILTVNPAALTLTAGSTNKTYGQTMLFKGTEFTSSGLVNGDTVTNVSLSSSGAGATASVANSPYAINASNATGAGLTNYTIQYQPGTLIVNRAPLAVTADDQTRMYSLTNPPLTASYVGFVNSDNTNVLQGSPALGTSANPSSPVGNYPITIAQGTLNADNYSFVFNSGTLTVTSAPVPVILSFELTNQVFGVTWSSVAGALYGLQYSSNLTDTGWNDISPAVTATGPTTSQTNSLGTDPQQFYRVKLQPATP
ncbi:MAG: MBG domain-containing protein, partial [Verrucomicrobiota bacterium]